MFTLLVLVVIVTLILHTKCHFGNYCFTLEINLKGLVNKVKNLVNKI